VGASAAVLEDALMAASHVPAAKQAILDRLAAIPALNAVAVTWGEGTEGEDLQPEAIFFDGPVIRQPEWRRMGGDLDELFTVTLRVENYQDGDDRANTEARTWALIAIIEQALRTDLTLGGLLEPRVEGPALEFGEQEVGSTPQSTSWRGVGVLPLICHARI
jgi:hypothetical protein